MKPVGEELANAWIGKGTGDAARLRPAGAAVYEVEAANGNGWSGEASRIFLPYEPAGVDEELLGVYFYNEDRQVWEYVGGKMDHENKRFVVEVSRPGYYAVMEYDKSFEDLPDAHWAHDAVKRLAARHIVNGVNDAEFAPNGLTTRAEFAALLVRALGLRGSTGAPFTDVGDDWYAGEIAAAYEAGLVQGVTADRFGPDERVTREQMAAMIVRAYEFAQETKVSGGGKMGAFRDADEVSAWAGEDVTRALELGLMRGRGSGRFAPRDGATRAEAAMAIWNLISAIDDIE